MYLNYRECGLTTGGFSLKLKNLPFSQKAYSCVVVFEYDVFRLMPFTGKFLLTDMYLKLTKEHIILGYYHAGDKFADVGKTDSIARAESLFP
ncbi:hypothetical protein [Terrimonas pollutisoli]|uniref:hypothetical protein n=1 Tax=Terrimonas pollutisoli TaxID=3034147 RepID=UPI0023EE0C02|nr:hypothetical protein [Terrimonas sp. H1YJ31]